MHNWIVVGAEIIILIFNLLIFMQLTILKKDNVATRAAMYGGTFLMMCAFVAAVSVFNFPEAISSFVCVTIPSAILFFYLSKYKDMRFFVTFCFLDTMTLVITFFSRATDIILGKTVGIIGYIVVCLLMCIGFVKGMPYFKRYRELMENVKDSWGAMAVCTALIYVLLIFTATYPKPLIERQEYFAPFLLLSITLVSFYVVFILSIIQRKRLYDLNIKLEKEKKWHKIAYEDVLTGMKNRMAYVEQINAIEREADKYTSIHTVMMDIDNFKNINDTFGHHFGDNVLKKAAESLNKIFEMENYRLFRIGGDEFAVIALDVAEDELREKIGALTNDEFSGCSFSVGWSKVRLDQNNAMENAFIRADMGMYDMKRKKKEKERST